MGNDRYDMRGGSRDERSRWSGDRDDYRGHDRGGREERGFFERAGEEIASWFGGSDDDDRHEDRHRERGQDQRHRGDYRDEIRRYGGDESRSQDRGYGGQRERSFGGQPQRGDDRQEWFGGRDRDRDRERREQQMRQPPGYRPMTGDYGRSTERSGGNWRDDDRHEDRDRGQRRGSEERHSEYSRSEGLFAASGYGRGGQDWSRDREPRGQRGREEFGRGERYGRSESNVDRDDYRRTSFAGSSERSRHDDPHYHEWRQRHLEELDRDYDDYRRERQSKFEGDFGGWRESRQTKRQMLGSIREHMEVVGRDQQHVGTVDRIAGDRIILTKSDPEAGGVHHSLTCTDVERIEGNRVILDCTADQARERWRDESRGRALFEREDQGEAGAHMLDRSFSGTYRR